MTKPKSTKAVKAAPSPSGNVTPLAVSSNPDAQTPETTPTPTEADKGPQINDVDATPPQEPTRSAFLLMLDEALAESEDADEREALVELIALVEDNPEAEAEFQQMAVVTFLEQVVASKLNPEGPSQEADPEDDEARAERIRENATAELAQLRADSLARQEAQEPDEKDQPNIRTL